MATMNGDTFLARALHRYGVSHFFYVPVIVPGAIKEMTALGMTPVMTHGEKAAAYMADGYARVARRPGVCGAQNIGGTNLAAGLRDAFQSRTPVIALTGGKMRATRYRLPYQEIDDMPIFEALTKFNATVDDATRLPDLLHTAFRAATAGMPSPVHLELSGFDGRIICEDIDVDLDFNARFGAYPSVRTLAPIEEVERIAAKIAGSKRPILVAGGGVRSSGAEGELCSLARKLNIPVATSLNAMGIVADDDALSVGVVGEYSRACANRAVYDADLVIFVGSLTGGLTTRNWSVPSAQSDVIHIDIEPENIGRNFPRTFGLCGDARSVLAQLFAAADSGPSRREWFDHISGLKAEWNSAVQGQENSDAVPMRPERLCRELSDASPDDAIIVGDTGHAGAWMAQNILVKSPKQRFIRAHGSLGWSLPAAIGAKCAAPDRPVICFTGDGGFFYHVAELETAVRYGIKIVVVVNNNSALNQEQDLWAGSDDWDKNWKFEPVDIVAIARGFGCGAARAERPDQLRELFRAAMASDRPFVIDATTDIAACSHPSWGPKGTASLYAPPKTG
jgi:acetolactate synthase-1/2/3 large subunit